MDSERWLEVRRILDAALDLPVAERRAFVTEKTDDPELQKEVLALVQAFEGGAARFERPALTEAELDATGRRVGPYELMHSIGAGGMGTVYRARRIDDEYQKVVAVKLLRPGRSGEDLLRRFRSERQILANLEHPNIARLLDGGSTESGMPYLVMEFVDGVPIDEFCWGLDIEARLRLFLAVCDAVYFAHRHLVVHRDLKPGNVLVTTDGVVQLLDFGIAKILRPETFPETVVPTDTGILPMTPEYCSPEQVLGRPITTATDVYSLGVLLYELLTGSRPYEISGTGLDAIIDAVCHSRPDRPSMVLSRRASSGSTAGEPLPLGRSLSGDVDAIVSKAMRKEPEERYASAGELAGDLRRHLDGQPVAARRSTLSYRVSKFARRHRWAVLTAALVFATLIGFVAVLLEQRSRILQERNRAEAIAGWLLELFELPSPTRAQGESITARELLDKGARSIAEQEGMEPNLRSDLLARMGETYTRLGLLPEGVDLTEQSLSLAGGRASSDRAVRGDRLHALARALTLIGDFERAEEVARKGLEVRLTLPGGAGNEADRAESLGQVAHLVDLRGLPGAADELFAPALSAAREAGDRAVLARILELYADLRMRQGRPDQARLLYREALGLLRQSHGDRHPDVALLLSSLASAEKTHDPDAAQALFESAIEIQRKVFNGPHPVLATALNNYGALFYERRRWQEARQAFAEALEMQTELYGDEHVKVASNLGNLANTERRLGRSERAAELYQQAVDIYQQQVGDEHPAFALALGNLGELKLEQGALDEAGELFDRGLEITLEHLGDQHPQLTTLLNGRGQWHLVRGDAEAAVLDLNRAIEVAELRLGDQHPVLVPALINLSVANDARGERAAAIAALNRAAGLTGPGIERWQIETSLADLHLRSEQWSAAEQHGRRAWEGWRQATGPDDVWALSAQSIFGRALLRQGHLEQAEPVLLDLLERMEQSPNPPAKRLRRALADLVELYSELDDPARAAVHRRRLSALEPG